MGIGDAAPVALHAALFHSGISKVTLQGGLGSWTSIAKMPRAKDHPADIVPGALKVYDLPDLVTALRRRLVIIRKAVDASGAPLIPARMEAACAWARGSPALVLVGP